MTRFILAFLLVGLLFVMLLGCAASGPPFPLALTSDVGPGEVIEGIVPQQCPGGLLVYVFVTKDNQSYVVVNDTTRTERGTHRFAAVRLDPISQKPDYLWMGEYDPRTDRATVTSATPEIPENFCHALGRGTPPAATPI